jgi:hypothetical protein
MDNARWLSGRIACAMNARKRCKDLAGDVRGYADPELSRMTTHAPKKPIEIAPVDELHREPGLGTNRTRREHLNDIFVVYESVKRRLALEHGAPLGIRHEVRQQALDDELARLRRGIERARHEDLRGTAHGKPCLEHVRSKLDRSPRQGTSKSFSRNFSGRHRLLECIYA